MQFGIARALGACLLASLSPALRAEQPAPAAGGAQAPSALRIPAGTPVDFEFVDRVHSKLNKPGDTFRIRLRQPLLIGGVTALPQGAEGRGEVIHAARARAGGKAGELILAARYIEHGGVRVTLRGFRFGMTGDDQRDAGLVAGLIAPGLGYLVVGGEVDVQPGSPGHAKVAADVGVTPAPAATLLPAPSPARE